MSEASINDPYPQPAGGWGPVRKVGTALLTEHMLFKAGGVMPHQNKTGGFACVGCAWAKPANPQWCWNEGPTAPAV